MEDLIIPATNKTPDVRFTWATKELTITGRCVPEEVVSFFAPIFDLIEESVRLKQPIILKIKPEYINTGSSKQIFEILSKIPDKSRIEWFYEADDSDYLEMGKDFQEVILIKLKRDVEFVLIEYV